MEPITDDQIRAAQLRRRAEEKLQKKQAKIDDLNAIEIQKLMHEMHVHQIELEMQNDELIQARISLEVARNHYADLYDFAPVGYGTFDKDGRILKANLTLADLVGIARGSLFNTLLYSCIVSEDRDILYIHLQQTFSTKIKQTCELRLLTTDGSLCWIQLSSRVVACTIECLTTLTDITVRKQAEEALMAMLNEKNVLLKEVHHRVKNNLMVVKSLISLQQDQTQDPHAQSLLRDLHNRIMAMAMVHQDLYQADNLARIDFGAYLEKLVDSVYHSFMRFSIAVRVTAGEVFLDIEKAIPCGLLVTELVTNSFKYAFPDPQTQPNPKVWVDLRREDSIFILTIGDNGRGIPAEIDWESPATLGHSLVHAWATRQLKGTLAVDRQQGTLFRITFADPIS